MKFLGIDPALKTTGFGIIESNKQNLLYIISGTIDTGSSDVPLIKRIAILYSGIIEILNRYQPNVVSIEKIFLNTNPRSTLSLCQARGAAIAALSSQDILFVEYSALEIKKAITGTGRADKKQMQEMVKHLLNMKKIVGTDASDALAAAICASRHKQDINIKI